MRLNSTKKVGLTTATLLVVANIIGSGIFITPGDILAGLPAAGGLLVLFVLGGVLALCGALSYGELASVYPRSGGEYNFLSSIYHPALGFSSGLISLVGGFAAPIALSAYGFGEYTSRIIPIDFLYGIDDAQLYGVLLIGALTVLHLMDIHYGAAVQNFFTLMKVSLIAFFGFSGLFSGPSNANPVWFPGEVSLWDSNFAGGLIGVYFAYSGWNAAVYLADEIENPRRNIPLALLNGTLIVTGLYLLLCYVFIKTVPLAALQGKVEVGYLAAVAIFGQTWGSLLTLVISLALVSSVSAMIMAGPRVMQAVGEDFPIFRQLARRNTAGVPAMAILLQSAIAVLLLLTARAGQILNFVGVTLSIFAFLSVLGVIITRMRGITTAAESYRLPGYPVVPIIFLAMNGGLIYGAFANKDSFYPSFSGVMLVLLGIVIYMGFRNEKKV